jgi:EmrB/QacA subfamily drug resistance transporter
MIFADARAFGPPGRAKRAAVVAVCGVSLFMIAIDTTVVNLALPLIGRGLRTPVSGLQWTIAAYTLTTASLMLTAGSVGDRFGRRAVFQAGLTIYSLASLGCSLAPGAGWLIAFRALQGAGGAALTPMSLGIIAATFTDPAERARAIGVWTGAFGVGMAAGPVIGGGLAAALGWRSVFWITVPPGAAAIVLARRVLPESRAARARRLDPSGQVLVIAFLACLVYAIIEGPSAGWGSAPILGAFAGAAVALAGLVACERRRSDPLIELRVFRSVPFSGALLITLCAFAGLGGFLFLTTLYLQDARGLGVWQAGLWLLPLAVGAAAAPLVTGRVLARLGARWPLVVGGAALAAGCLLLVSASPSAPALLLTAAFVAFGAGYGMVNTVVFAAAVAGLPSAQAGVAGGISSAGRQAGQSLGVSVTGAILAVGLHGTLHHSFAAASHPAWILNAICGLAVLVLGLVTTSPRAIRTAARVAAPGSQLTAERVRSTRHRRAVRSAGVVWKVQALALLAGPPWLDRYRHGGGHRADGGQRADGRHRADGGNVPAGAHRAVGLHRAADAGPQDARVAAGAPPDPDEQVTKPLRRLQSQADEQVTQPMRLLQSQADFASR